MQLEKINNQQLEQILFDLRLARIIANTGDDQSQGIIDSIGKAMELLCQAYNQGNKFNIGQKVKFVNDKGVLIGQVEGIYKVQHRVQPSTWKYNLCFESDWQTETNGGNMHGQIIPPSISFVDESKLKEL